MKKKISNSEISEVFKKALAKSALLEKNDTSAIFYDLSYLEERINDLRNHFPANTLHTVAVKANPLVKILSLVKETGAGLEAASLPELHLTKRANVQKEKVVFDSPAKTMEEIKFVLEEGFFLNADSLDELKRIGEILKSINSKSGIGIRINPQVGSGSIDSTSVAGEYSKFGVPLGERREELTAAFLNYPWLNGVHLHIGSQGCPVELLIDGIGRVLEFAEQTDHKLEITGKNNKIEYFDIGGGLPVSYHQDKEAVSMAEYAAMIKSNFPLLFSGKYKLITEFGRYIHANTGWTASRIEYVKQDAGINTLVIHLGADMFLRKCYRPEDWHHDIFLVDQEGHIKATREMELYNVAGPLCFADDFIAKGIYLPKAEPDDFIIIRDTGAYTLSMWSRYNSRQIPPVIGYTDDGDKFHILKKGESPEDVINFWE